MLKMKIFWLIFRGKFEQKTQKSIFLKNQWKLKNIKKAIVVKNIIAEEMPFTKSIFEQFWRRYCKKTIFVVFHFLKFLPILYIKFSSSRSPSGAHYLKNIWCRISNANYTSNILPADLRLDPTTLSTGQGQLCQHPFALLSYRINWKGIIALIFMVVDFTLM